MLLFLMAGRALKGVTAKSADYNGNGRSNLTTRSSHHIAGAVFFYAVINVFYIQTQLFTFRLNFLHSNSTFYIRTQLFTFRLNLNENNV